MSIPTLSIDARQPGAPLPVPTPGFGPLAPAPGFGMPLTPIPPYGVSPYGMPLGAAPTPYGMPLGASAFGAPPTPVPLFGTPLGMPPVGMQPAPIYTLGAWQAPIAPYGVSPFGASQAPVPWAMTPVPFGTPQGIPPTPFHGYGISPFGAQLGGQPAPIPPLGIPPVGGSPAPIPGMIPPPYPLTPAAAFLLSQIGLKEAAAHVGDEAVKAKVIAGANEAIARATDDLAGVTLHPWFRAGALAWSYPVVADLALLASKYREGAVRTELLNVAGQLLAKGLGPSAEDLAGGGRRK
jgi:hypothetical protein